MPRHTHPLLVSKHSRAQVRAQRERTIAKRWRFAKNRYPESAVVDPHVPGTHEQNLLREQNPGLVDALAPIVFLHPDDRDPALVALRQWPFLLPRGSFTRDPFTHTCRHCNGHKTFDPRRARERRELRDVIADARVERDVATDTRRMLT